MVKLCKNKIFTKEKYGDKKMENNKSLLKKEVEYLKEELYDLLEKQPWAQHDILKLSKYLDNLILKFYRCD